MASKKLPFESLTKPELIQLVKRMAARIDRLEKAAAAPAVGTQRTPLPNPFEDAARGR
jgi:hypothetical protein